MGGFPSWGLTPSTGWRNTGHEASSPVFLHPVEGVSQEFTALEWLLTTKHCVFYKLRTSYTSSDLPHICIINNCNCPPKPCAEKRACEASKKESHQTAHCNFMHWSFFSLRQAGDNPLSPCPTSPKFQVEEPLIVGPLLGHSKHNQIFNHFDSPLLCRSVIAKSPKPRLTGSWCLDGTSPSTGVQ